MIDKIQLTSPCGLDCFNCELYKGNLTDKLAEIIHSKLKVPKKDIPCKGCRQQNGNHFHLGKSGCATLECVKNKGVDFCYNCDGFPCAYLAPTADGATKYPHNLKAYNLSRIKSVGIEQWIEEVEQIRNTYFNTKFVAGLGQAGLDSYLAYAKFEK